MLPTRVELMISTLLVWRLTNLAIEAVSCHKKNLPLYTPTRLLPATNSFLVDLTYFELRNTQFIMLQLHF